MYMTQKSNFFQVRVRSGVFLAGNEEAAAAVNLRGTFKCVVVVKLFGSPTQRPERNKDRPARVRTRIDILNSYSY